MTPADALLRLALVPGLGPLTAQRLLATVDEPAEIFGLGMQQLMRLDGIGPERARRICDPSGEDLLASERARAHSAGIRILTPCEADYPRALTLLDDPPLAIWQRGTIIRRDQLAVAVVGPRKPSAYGHRMAQRLAGGLARIGCCIVSGLARGIDTVAHEAALQQGGRTLAVIGSGFEQLYPAENHALVERIVADHGAVLSEFPLATRPAPGHFPRRNRLVAALALGVLVVEAEKRSGALITARLAGEQGKEVMALPGPIDRPEAQGANQLIRDGATLITCLDDILHEIEPLHTLAGGATGDEQESPRASALSGRERELYTLLSDEVRSPDELVRISRLPASIISATLISLEIKRCVRKLPGGYVRAV